MKVAEFADRVARANTRVINRIRNPHKRQYAEAYLRWLATGQRGESPAYACSYMAAQAVRMSLHEIMGAPK